MCMRLHNIQNVNVNMENDFDFWSMMGGTEIESVRR